MEKMSEKNEVMVSAPSRLKAILNSESIAAQFKTVLKENSESFTASVLELYTSDSYLQQCNPKDVCLEALKLAALKLPISKSLGFAYIIPFKGKAQAQIGYKGLIQLAIRSGAYLHISADYIHEGELVSCDKVTGKLVLNEGDFDDKPIVGYFAHLKLVNGFEKSMYWTVEKVEAHAKKFSQGFQKGSAIWKTNFHEMAKKTVLKNLLSHWGLLSIEMVSAIDQDNETVSFKDEEMASIDISATVVGTVDNDVTVDTTTGEIIEEPSF